MAKYDVKFSCGHVETIQLYGKEADRAKKIAWFEEHGECSACYKARIAAAHAAETAAAAAKAAEENLPALTGSEKQVNWALSIRAKKFADLDKMLADMTTTDEQLRRQNQIAIQATKNVLASKTESRFWIDNRNVEARKLIAVNNLQDALKAEFARLNTAEASATEVDADEYAISVEAQDIAVDAEISAATAIKAHESSFRRVLATVKECRSYAETYMGEAQWADRMVEDVDTRITEYPNDESLKEVRGEYLAEADNYRAQAQIALTQADTLETALANDSTLTAAQQSIISTATTTEQEENTMTTRDRYLAAKEVVSVRHNCDNGRDEWYINGKRTNKKNAADTLKSYGLTLDTFKAEHEAYINEQIAEGARQMVIDDQAEHVSDKVAREVKPCDDNDEVYALMPDADELNDVENFDDELILPTCVVDEKSTIDEPKSVDDYDSKRQQRRADNDIPQDYLNAIVAQTMPRKRREPINDAELIANGDELKAIEGRIMGRDFPRFGQPRFDAPLVEWYREYQFRRKNPFWYEDEYHYLDDGTRIHAKKNKPTEADAVIEL